MVKCIASDMDGTLLNSQGMISENNKQAIELAKEKGIEFLVATGRSWEEARYVLDKEGIDCAVICVNGAEIRSRKGDILYSIGLDGATAEKVAQVFDEVGMYYELYTPEGTLSADEALGVQSLVDIYHTANPSEDIDKIRDSVKRRFTHSSLRIVDQYKKIFQAKDCQIYKFLAFSMNEDLLLKVSERLKDIEGIEVTSSGRHNIEIGHREAQKGIALKRWTEILGISLQDTMAIGDNYNDLSMFERVGHSFAMGNAEPAIKEVCRYTTDTNLEDGVAKAIKKLIG
ncbi:Cof-type HAD-IIB family hydrolase [Bacillus sp. SD088]|uniref:Cof-type HAD-IIB family hydrolase n=1 Tax=Bacillus sp. SD088 TaxID=2782012 RepID=UPI001A95E490|nr:Cof-type HAD-IIB family hydrolase [Bacillus sp. SD088]MBO0991625.1 HAD family phosphatase [Bacillus sp. SD088]